MSFSKEVKSELAKQISSSRHCRIAELAAIVSLCGRIKITKDDEYRLFIHTENFAVAVKSYILIRKVFAADMEVSVRMNIAASKSSIYIVAVKDARDSKKILEAVKLIDEYGDINEDLSVSNIVIQNTCCKRAFIRGAFLAAGSITDPKKSYHFEITSATMEKAVQLQRIIAAFDIEAKIIQRKKYYVVYIKEGNQIVDILNVMEAHKALMDLENVRILKEMRNSINRQVNCEAANIRKSVTAASRQIQDIELIAKKRGLDSLTDGLRQVAQLRLENEDMPLKDLGLLLDPPISKSGVNHRLRKLSSIADIIRGQQKEDNQNDN